MSPQTQPSSPPVALSIAGSDPSGGAGIQADLKTFAAHGAYGLSALTCSTAQVPGRVVGVSPVDPEHLRDQLSLLLETYPIAAIKTGMLHSAPLMRVVADTLAGSSIPLVVDPVMVASSGDSLLGEGAVEFYRSDIIPSSALFTPNLDEAAVLLERSTPITRPELEESAMALFERYAVPVLLKGGHLRGDEAIDILVTGESLKTYRAPFVKGFSTHGTGCTYSAAIAANLAFEKSLPEAVAAGKHYISAAIANSFRWGSGVDALNHAGDMMPNIPREHP
jgi:hydroxymethylpyrimidine/phosphomethylpyrimidine kinase